MRILVVDNGSSFLPVLLKRLPRKGTCVVKRSSLSHVDPREFDVLVLSGGHSYAVKNHKRIYKKEIELIRKFKGSVLGICLGFELIVVAFGGALVRMEKKEKGLTEIKLLRKGGIFNHIRSLFAATEAHRWSVKTVPKNLMKLAVSRDGIEIIQNRTGRILGLQFHPEATSKKSDAYKIIANFLKTKTVK
jgi:GMP synthase-like glutamine amidotransferase